MSRRILWALVMLLFAASWSAAELPDAERIRADLDGPYATTAAQPRLERRGELARRVEAILLKQCQFQINALKPWPKTPAAMMLGKGTSGEIDIRSNGHLLVGLATVYRAVPAEAGEEPSRQRAKECAIGILRFVLPTHGAGGRVCANGKAWHNQWQSAFWAHSIGKAAWLLWDDLDPQLKWLAARMVCDEADRFVGVTPPAQVDDDTKAEENAWDSMVIALAYNMFPHHPHHEAWRETAIRWSITSFVTSKDVERTDVVDGRPLKEWLTGPNIHDDYTLENHNRVHPDYMSTVRLNLAEQLEYAWGGNEVPAALSLNADKVYANLKKLAFPDGAWIYPNGEDWQLHHPPDWVDLDAMIAIRFNDPQAAELLRICLATAEKMVARHPATGIFGPEEILVSTTYTIPCEYYADAYLLMRAEGEGPPPVGEEELWKAEKGTHVFNAGKFAVVRSDRAIATFSWGRQVMGMVLPFRKDLLLTPNDRGLIGNIETQPGKRDQPVVKESHIASIGDGFAITGVLDRAAGAAEQLFGFVALPDGRTIYVDSLHLVGTKRPAAASMGLLGVLNDTNWVYHDGRRTAEFGDGQRGTFVAADATNSAQPVAMSSTWYCIDGLGVACLKTSGKQVYHPKPNPVRGRLEQIFSLSSVDPEHLDRAQTALVFYPSVDAQAAREVATKCRLSQPDPLTFVVTLDDGKTVTIDLGHMAVRMGE